MFLNTAGDLLDDEQEGALEAFIEDGGGFLGIGSAAQSEVGTEFFDGLIGARPSAASSTSASVQRVVAGDRVHPATKDLPLETDRTDVWYQWQTRPTGTVHTVARYHATNAPAGDGTNAGGTDTPISWCRDYEGGRSFYTGMGRTAGSFAEEGFRDHLLGAVRWTAGLVRANCKATINSSYKATKIVTAGAEELGLRNAGESHGLVTAPNGWVLYIGRGDCRTDAERGELLGLPTLGRVFNHADPNVGIGCGSVHIYDPAAATDGTLNSGVTEAGKLAVYGDGGQGGERTDQGDHKMEYGLLGITVAPDFDTTGHIYLQYFPSFNPASKPAGLPLERRVSKMSRPRISRFTIDLDTKQLDLDSEVRIFEYDAQIYSCCHVGGGMGFDSEGNLYVTTGDTNSSQGSDGYSGNNPVAKCPTGPDNQPSSTHCGTANYSYQDARRTAGNTNDYNGKMLRFRPLPDIPDGEQPAVGVGTTYALPTEGPRTGRTCSAGPRGTGTRRSRRSTPWACATPRGSTSTRRRTSRTRPGSARTPARRARRSVPRRTRTRRRSTAPATTAGPTAWATPRPTATGPPTGSRAPTARRATCPAAPPPAGPKAGTTATTFATTRPTTPAWSSSRTTPGPAWTRGRSAR